MPVDRHFGKRLPPLTTFPAEFIAISKNDRLKMIELDTRSGVVKIRGLLIKPTTTLLDIETRKNDFELSLMVANAGYSLYKIKWKDLEAPIPCLQFYEGKLISVDIGVGYHLSDEKRKVETLALLETLGGEQKYEWGGVREVIDDKGLDRYVLISYIHRNSR